MNFSISASKEVAESQTLFVSRVFLVLINSISLVLNLCTATGWLRSTERHLNQRIIFLNMCLAAILNILSHLAKSTHFFLNYKKENGLVMSARTCILTEVVASIVARSIMFFIIGASTERIIAVQFHSTYEHWSCALVMLWVSLVWAQAIGFYFYFFSFSREDILLPYCSFTLNANRSQALALVAVYAGIGLLTLLMYLYCWQTARKLLKKFSAGHIHLSLSSRMQLRQNIDSTMTLLPTILWHFILFTTLQTFMAIVLFVLPLSATDSVIYAVQIDLFLAAYFLFDAAILLYFVLLELLPQFLTCFERCRERSMLHKLNHLLRNEKRYDDDDSKYFEALQSFWQAAAKTSSQNNCHRHSSLAVVDCSENNHAITTQEIQQACETCKDAKNIGENASNMLAITPVTASERLVDQGNNMLSVSSTAMDNAQHSNLYHTSPKLRCFGTGRIRHLRRPHQKQNTMMLQPVV